MATVNRYTNIEPAKYNPRSLQELMMVPVYKRQQHTATEEQLAAAETALAQVDPLALHSDRAKMEQQKLYDQITAQSEQLANKGFTSTSKSDVIRLNKNYQQAISPIGELGKIQTAKKTLELNKASYIANATKLGFPADTTAKNWEDEEAKYKAEFEATGKITNIQERYAPNYINATDKLQELFKEAGVYSNELGTLTSSIVTNDPNNPGQYILTQGAKEAHSSNIKQLQYAVDYINNQINNPNSEIGRSLKEQRKTTADALQEVEGLNKVFEKKSDSVQTSSEISGYKSPAELGINSPSTTPLRHEYDIDTSVEIYSNAIIKKLDNVLSGAPHITGGGPKMATSGTGLNMSGSIITGKYPTSTEPSSITNQLSAKERKEYDEIFTVLQQNNKNLKGVSPYSKLGVKTIRDYFDKNKSIQRQDIIVTDEFVKMYGDRGVGADATTKTQIAELVKANPKSREYAIDGKVYTYNQLPEEIQKNFNDITYSGYYSPKNFMTKKYGTLQDKKLFVSPLKMQYRHADGKLTTLLVSRDATELNSPEYIADTEFNDTFVNTNSLIDKPYTIPLPNGKPSNTQVMYLSDKVNQGDKVLSYMINQKDEDGNFGAPTLITEEELQDFFMNANGAIPRTTKKKK